MSSASQPERAAGGGGSGQRRLLGVRCPFKRLVKESLQWEGERGRGGEVEREREREKINWFRRFGLT